MRDEIAKKLGDFQAQIIKRICCQFDAPIQDIRGTSFKVN